MAAAMAFRSARSVTFSIALALTSVAASAGCATRDRWAGQDKMLHLGAGSVAAVAVGSQFKSPWAGFAAGVAIGAAKELTDSRGAGTCSLQDLVATAVGAGLGAYASKWAIAHADGNTSVRITTTF